MTTKAQLREQIASALHSTVSGIAKSEEMSKKTLKLIRKASKRISYQLDKSLKKQLREDKSVMSLKEVLKDKKSKSKGQKAEAA